MSGSQLAAVGLRGWRAPGAGGVAAGLFLILALGVALLEPEQVWMLLASAALLGCLLLALRFPAAACVAWLLASGSTPEYWLADLVGGDVVITAAMKLVGLVLVGVCLLRYGPRADPFNPGLAFLAMFAAGTIHGFHPNLTMAESLRTLVGSVAPFAFAFVRAPRRWADAVIRATIWLPPLVVLAGTGFALAGIRPLFGDMDGWRLGALGHPAFLAGFALTAIYAALIELFRFGRSRDAGLLAVNFAILVLTGARAPLALAVLVCALSLLALPSRRFPARARVPWLLAAGLLLCAMVVLASQLTSFRLFNVLNTEAGTLSGRETLWPFFQEAWDASPWFGWGVGAGKMLIDPDSLVAHLLGTSTAHNEYLRVGVDGGWVGLGLLVALFALWAAWHTRRLRQAERIIIRLVFLAFAVHSFTDSTLIASTASVMFAWVAAIFARGEMDRMLLPELMAPPAPAPVPTEVT